jgi:tripartite-type tricarboxylate transporter receptor subunit TctC
LVVGFPAGSAADIIARAQKHAEVVDKLNKEINVGLADSKIKARLAELGGTAMPMTPPEVGKLIGEECGNRAKIIGAANVKPE